jgi:hypothetical protein
MQCDFYQKRLFDQRWFNLTDNGLGTRVIQSHNDVRGFLTASVILTFISIFLFADRLSGGDVETGAELFYLLPGIAFAIAYFVTYKRSYYLVKSNNTNAVEFLYNRPSKQQLGDFVNHVRFKRKEHLMELYGKLNLNLSYELQYNNLTWLLENDVLTKAEYDEKVLLLNKSMPITTPIKGFEFGIN